VSCATKLGVCGKVLYSISPSVLPPATTLFAGFPFKGWPIKRPLRSYLVCSHRTSSTKAALPDAQYSA
jgi:hypothetical protein